MVTVTFDDVVYENPLETSEKYRLVLFVNEQREFRSAYRSGTNVFKWKRPFGERTNIETHAAANHVTIELRSKGWPGFRGRKVCSYTLHLDHNCQSETFTVSANEPYISSPPQLSVTVTIFGLAGTETNHADEVTRIPAVQVVGPEESGVSAADRHAPNVAGGLYANEPAGPIHLSINPATRGANDQLLSQALTESNDVMRSQSSLDLRAPSIAESNTDVAGPAAEATSQIAWSGVSRISAVMELVNVAADIHPLVKGVWSLLNLAYTLAKQQSDLDIKVGDLVNALDANCELARVLTEDQIGGVAETIVTKILREVLNGADVIKEYCNVRTSKLSAFKFAGSTTAIRVNTCLQTLEVFRRNLADHVAANVRHDLRTLASTLEVELKAVKAQLGQIGEYVQKQEDKELLDQMPFAPEADRALKSRDRGCLPDTRIEIIDAIVNWAIGADADTSQPYIKGLHRDSRILWLCGVAGSGKSSIAISVARALRLMDRLAALYGFEKALQTSLNPKNLFSTIARQRADRRPEHKRDLLQKLQQMQPEMRAITDAEEQLKLFMATTLAGDTSAADDVIVIDAFDESGSTASRSAALQALSPDGLNVTFPERVRFIITSRYDHDVALRLESIPSSAQPILSVVRMEDIRSADTERDIRSYVFHKLEGVVGLKASDAAGEITQLAMAAEHSFQWASTSCLHILQDDDDALRTPIIRLREILATRGGLYGLYLSILNQHFKSSLKLPPSATRPLRAILGSLVCALEPLSIGAIASLATADLPTSDAPSYRLIARRLSSIVTGTHDESTPLIPLHTSFTDFLCDPEHSGDYAVASHDVHAMLGLACLTVMKRLLHFNICDLETSFPRNDAVPDLAERIRKHIPDELSYACRFWPAHVAAALSSDSSDPEPLRQPLFDFLKNKPLLLQWLEVMSLTGTDAHASLSPLLFLQANDRDLSDLLLFITYFSVPISLSVPHIYLSALAFAPSSSTIASTGTHFPNLVRPDKPLSSWPQVRHKLEHALEVQSVTWSPDGRWLVSGEGDDNDDNNDEGGAVCVWDVYLGRLMLPRVATTSAVLSVAISPDGSVLATGHKDGTVQLWNAHTLAAKGSPLNAHSDFVRSVAFSPTQSLLASGSDDQTVALWDVVTHSTVGDRFKGHSGYVRNVTFSPDGEMLLSGSSDKTIRLWDVHTHSARGDPLEGHTGRVRCVSLSPDGSLLASGSDDQTVCLWDMRSGTAVGKPLVEHSGTVRFVTFSPDGQTLASCSEDKTVQLWDVESRSPLSEPLTGHTGKVFSVAFSPDGALLASSSSDKTVHIWDARVLASNRESSATQFKIQDFATCSPDGKFLASGSDDNTIQLWDVHSVFTVREPLKGHTNSVRSVAFSPDGTLLASGSDDRNVRLWDARTGLAVGEPLRGHSNWVWAVTFSPDGKLLASASMDKTVRLWDMHAHSASGTPLTGHSGYATSVAFSPDGSTLASGDSKGTVLLWDVQTRSQIGQALEGHSASVRCVSFSLNGTLLASGSYDRNVRIWDVHTQSAVGEPLKGHTSPVTSLVFSLDGALLVSSSWDEGVVRVWKVRAPSGVGEPVALLRHESNVYSIAFAPTSPILSSITSGGVVRKWDLQYLLSTRTPKVYSLESHPKKHPSLLLPDHPDLSSLPPDFLEVLDDGWVVGPKQELVLWIPPAIRPSLSNLLEIERFGGSSPTFLDFTNFVCGSDWTKCHSPPSTLLSQS